MRMPAEPVTEPKSTGWLPALGLILLCGAVLRLIWVGDMEYKADERWFFEQTQSETRDSFFPWLGLPSSTFALNPGTVSWPFVVLGWLTGATEPTQLARAVQVVNVLALLALAYFALRVVPAAEREPWLWAVALLAVNPITVLMHRKIWNVSVLLPLTVPVLIGWWYRRHRFGAFTWGLASLAVAAVYPPGIWFAIGLALWTALFDRKSVAWLDWAIGSSLGAAPLLPWVGYMMEYTSRIPLAGRGVNNLGSLPFYRYWPTEPFGISLHYSLKSDFWEYLRGPHWYGMPNYLVGALHVAMLGLMVAIILGWLGWFFRERRALAPLFFGNDTQTGLLQSSYLWAGGLLATLTLMPFHRHGMQLVAPLMCLWVARLALRSQAIGRGLLVALVAVQLGISASFLGYIHTHNGPIRGDYGLPYSQQVALENHTQEKTR